VGRNEVAKSLGTNNRKVEKILLRRIQQIAERLFLLAGLKLSIRTSLLFCFWTIFKLRLQTLAAVENSQSTAERNAADEQKQVMQIG
jgi:hypothetical protein